MDSAEEKFFESLAKGGKRERELEEEETDIEETGGEPEAELAKADAVTVNRDKLSRKAEDAVETEGQLTIDVYQTPEDIVVESAIAGVKPEDIDIDVSPDSVTVRGERRREHHVKEDDYFYQECYWGRFSRSVILPQEVDPERASVNFKNGILTVRMPKMNRHKARKLKVKFE